MIENTTSTGVTTQTSQGQQTAANPSSISRSRFVPKVVGNPNKETLDTIVDELNVISKDFPELEKWVKKLDFESSTRASEGMQFDQDGTIYLQKYLAGLSPKEISEYMRSDTLIGDGSFQSSIIHEIGHAIERNTTVRLRSLRDVQEEYLDEIYEIKRRTGKISEYGEKNIREYTAELFTRERLTGGSELQSVFRKYIDLLHKEGLAELDWDDVPFGD